MRGVRARSHVPEPQRASFSRGALSAPRPQTGDDRAAAAKGDDYGSRIGRVPGATTILRVDAIPSKPGFGAVKAGWS